MDLYDPLNHSQMDLYDPLNRWATVETVDRRRHTPALRLKFADRSLLTAEQPLLPESPNGEL